MPQLLKKCNSAGCCLILKLAGQPQQIRSFDSVSLQAVSLELLRARTAANRRQVYVNSLRYYLDRFTRSIGSNVEIGLVSTAKIERFLSPFHGYTRQTWLNRISTLFSFAVRREIIERNPCDCIDRITIDRSPPVVLTVEQSKTLLKTCPVVCRPFLILGMYAGIRPDELHRMNWSDINLDAATVKVDGKTRQRRIVTLEAIAINLLAQHPLKSGPLAPSRSTVKRWKKKARAHLGGKWTADILRHTAASYLLAKHQDIGKVSFSLGNSPKILLRHYHDPVSPAECKKFWDECQTMSNIPKLELRPAPRPKTSELRI